MYLVLAKNADDFISWRLENPALDTSQITFVNEPSKMEGWIGVDFIVVFYGEYWKHPQYQTIKARLLRSIA